jgi:hypothetical protein
MRTGRAGTPPARPDLCGNRVADRGDGLADFDSTPEQALARRQTALDLESHFESCTETSDGHTHTPGFIRRQRSLDRPTTGPDTDTICDCHVAQFQVESMERLIGRYDYLRLPSSQQPETASVEDPEEKQNLYRDPAYRETRAHLQQRLNERMKEINDPLTTGK